MDRNLALADREPRDEVKRPEGEGFGERAESEEGSEFLEIG